MMTAEPLLDVVDLDVVFDMPGTPVHAVRGVSFSLARGEIVGVVGESGCGKSVTAMSLLRLVDSPGRIAGGTVLLQGRDLTRLTEEELRAVRGREISMIFQDPMTSLNPVFTVGRQLDDVQRAHGRRDKALRRRRAVEMLGRLGVPDPASRLCAYPHQFSGGMRQRVMIAMALLNDPLLLIADEPTTALDVTVQAQILELLRELNAAFDMAILFISHDLRVVAELCERVLVLYAGRVVEAGPTAEVFAAPRHPYTRALLRSLPDPDADGSRRLATISGAPPSLAPPPAGCAFAPRCDLRHARCADDPAWLTFPDGRATACWLHEHGLTPLGAHPTRTP